MVGGVMTTYVRWGAGGDKNQRKNSHVFCERPLVQSRSHE